MAQLRQQCDADALSYKSQVAALQGDLSALKSKHFALEQTAQQSDAELAELRTRLFGASSELAEAEGADQVDSGGAGASAGAVRAWAWREA